MRYIFAILTILLASNVDAQRISMSRRVMPSIGGGAVQPTDWTTSTNTIAVWRLEEDGSTVRDNAEGTSANDLTSNSASNARSTTKMEGTYSNDIAATLGRYLYCADATCTQLDLSSSYTMGCWARPDVTSNLRRIIAKGTSTTTVNSTGYMVARDSSSRLQCENTTTESVASNNSFPVDQWTHAVCKSDGTNLRPFINGVASGSNVAVGHPSTTATEFRIGARADTDTANQKFDGLLDECFVAGAALSADQICRIARCGYDGSYCLCSDNPATSYRSCATDLDCNIYSANATCNTTSGKCEGRSVGTCSGGSVANASCASDSECTGGGTCVVCSLASHSCNDSGP